MADSHELPLWQTMYEAAAEASDACSDADNTDGAAMIRALADWLVPEEPHTIPMHKHGYEATMERWAQRQELRQLLLAEADRAEAGDG